MLSLKIPKEPYWIELGMGVKVKVRPFTSPLFYAAQAQARKEIDEGEDEGQRIHAFTTALAQLAIVEWEGILSPDSDKPAPVTTQAINDLMLFWTIADEFRTQYTGLKELLDAEKKPCSSGASGTSGEDPNIVKDALSKTSRAAKATKTKKAYPVRTLSTS